MSFPQPDTTDIDPTARTITYRWRTGQVVGNEHRTGEMMVALSVFHSAHFRVYEASLYTLEVYPNGTRRSFRLADPDATTTNSSVLVRNEPVKRYGRKALDEFAAAALIDLNNSEDPNVAAFRILIPAPTAPDFERIGAQAYANGDMRAPALNAEVQAALKGLPVGGGGYDIMAAFSRGWNAAHMAAPDDLD